MSDSLQLNNCIEQIFLKITEQMVTHHSLISFQESIRNEDHKNTNVATFNTMVILKQEVFDDDMDIKQERDPLDYHQDNIFIDIDDDDDEDLEPPGEEKDYFDNNRIKETERYCPFVNVWVCVHWFYLHTWMVVPIFQHCFCKSKLNIVIFQEKFLDTR